MQITNSPLSVSSFSGGPVSPKVGVSTASTSPSVFEAADIPRKKSQNTGLSAQEVYEASKTESAGVQAQLKKQSAACTLTDEQKEYLKSIYDVTSRSADDQFALVNELQKMGLLSKEDADSFDTMLLPPEVIKNGIMASQTPYVPADSGNETLLQKMTSLLEQIKLYAAYKPMNGSKAATYEELGIDVQSYMDSKQNIIHLLQQLAD